MSSVNDIDDDVSFENDISRDALFIVQRRDAIDSGRVINCIVAIRTFDDFDCRSRIV